ncbi:MAG TPA: hypothetical protein VM843_09315 [Flavisolibacter sp.]|nr:hypothetical protein [Flavisolibacter sp.]
MKRPLKVIIFCLLLAGATQGFAQDTLPKFSLRNVGNNRVIIGWINQFPTIRQISIQRSFDSLTNFKTILTVADPKAVQNGFADTKAPNDHMFYRLFYAMEGGSFYFTETKKPILDTASTGSEGGDRNLGTKPATDPALASFMPSFYVFTNKTGYLQLNLPNADQKKYMLKFFEEDDSFLFELKDLKEGVLTLDKANFHHAGWFKFELYDGEKVVEKHKFYISKDF